MNEGQAMYFVKKLREIAGDQTSAPSWLIKEIKEKYKTADPKIQEFFRNMVSKKMPNFILEKITG